MPFKSQAQRAWMYKNKPEMAKRWSKETPPGPLPTRAKKKQKVIEVKEIKLRPNIDEHDYQVKMRSVQKFLDEGDKVKVTLRFRGREMAHQELGVNVLNRVREDTDEVAKIEAFPKLEGRQMIMVIAPK